MLIAHCPGHGIKKHGVIDSGCDHNGIVEADVVLDIAMSMHRRSSIGGATVSGMPLRESLVGERYDMRAKMAKNIAADLVICHHINAHDNSSARGMLVFYQETDEIGRQVADMMERAAPFELIRKGHDDDIATRRGDWTRNANWVMGHYRKYGIPCVLVEWGFATNTQDAMYLLDQSSRPAMAACVLAGAARALEFMKGK
jgi:N-acetylmuramoyl-L-alanine amidase